LLFNFFSFYSVYQLLVLLSYNQTNLIIYYFISKFILWSFGISRS